jgi:DnaJ family protein B protein 11
MWWLFFYALQVRSFFEQILNQAFQGGKSDPVRWPANVPTSVSAHFDWLKGTEWQWNDWRNVRFHGDGRFEAPTAECQRPGDCRWSSSSDTVYILWGRAGIHWVRPSRSVKASDKAEAWKGLRLAGKRNSDGVSVFAEFRSIFEPREAERRDLYEVLEIGSEAEVSEVKRQYRKLSILYHPDKNPAPEAVGRFRELTEAYEVLSDATQRLVYDLLGFGGLEKLKKNELAKGQDRTAEVTVDLAQFYVGGDLQVSFKRRSICKKSEKCGKCPSEIQTIQQMIQPGFVIQQQIQVESKHFCRSETVTESVRVSPGTKPGAEIRIAHASDQSGSQIPGDLVVRLRERKDERFERLANAECDDLRTSVEVTLTQSLLGFEKQVELPDGSFATVQNSQVTQPFQVLSVPNRGFLCADERGPLLVKVKVRFPTVLSELQKEGVRKILLRD